MQSWSQPWENLGRWHLLTETSSVAIYWSQLGNSKCKTIENKTLPTDVSITVKDNSSALGWSSGTL